MAILEERKSFGKPILQILVASTFLFTVFGVILTFFVGKHHSAPSLGEASLPVYGKVADFNLTERSGKTFSLKDLEGTVWIADFMFTHCPGQCPRMSWEVSHLQGKLPKSVRFVSFTADPEKDTPEVLSQYAEAYEAEKTRWFFLTGEKKDLNRVAASFHMGSIDDPNQHSVRLVLIDREGQIRGYYDPTASQSLEKLMSDAEKQI